MRRTFFLEIDMSDDVTDDERQDIYQYIRELLSTGSGGRSPVENLPSRPPKLARLQLARVIPIHTTQGTFLYEKVRYV